MATGLTPFDGWGTLSDVGLGGLLDGSCCDEGLKTIGLSSSSSVSRTCSSSGSSTFSAASTLASSRLTLAWLRFMNHTRQLRI
ncbi:hypothetical protein ABBQ32_012381 [Trebouxia sp. C0010 RCD-2024]